MAAAVFGVALGRAVLVKLTGPDLREEWSSGWSAPPRCETSPPPFS